MNKPQASSKAAAANATYAASESFEGSSCTTLKIATRDSIAIETMTTTRKRDSTRRARAAALNRNSGSNSYPTTVCAESIAAIAMVSIAMQLRIRPKRFASVRAAPDCTDRQSSRPAKEIRAMAQPANIKKMTAKPSPPCKAV